MNELLNLLKQNALESPENLAKILGLSTEEVIAKIAAYEEKGIICAYQALVNEERMANPAVTTVIEVKITPESTDGFDRIADQISQFPEVDSVFLMSGGFDLLLFIKDETMRAAAGFVSEKLAVMSGVTSTSTHFVLKTYKKNGIFMKEGGDSERLKISP